MQRLWQLLFGVDSSGWMEEGDWSLDWVALPSGDRMLLLLVVVAVGIAGVAWLYRWNARRHGWRIRTLLTAIRVGVLLLAATMLLEPVLVVSREEFIPSHLLVLVDQSPSMGLRDAWKDEADALRVAESLKLDGGTEALRSLRRVDLSGAVLTREMLAAFAQNGDRVVHVHPFADRLSEATLSPGDEITTGGESTAIGNVLRQARMLYAGQPLAGIVLLTDGQSTAGEPVDDAARKLAEENIPVAAIPIGTVDGPRNASIPELEANPVALVRDENRMIVHVQSRGMQDVPGVLRVERRINGGEWEDFATRDLIFGLDGVLQQVEIAFSEDRPARLEFRASLAETGPQLTRDDDVASIEVRIVRDRMRVLFIAGTTFPEVEFLRNALYRDPKIEMSSWLMSADEDYEHRGDLPIRRLPVTQEELDDYDCVLLYDPDPGAWPANFGELLTAFVSRAGGGLVYIAGEHSTAKSFDRQADPSMGWLNLLPVIREPGLFRSEVQLRLSAQSPWRLQITEQGRDDAVFRFVDDEEANVRLLENLPGMYWHFPVTRAKPGAQVLAVHGDPRMRNEHGPEVLLATHRVGPGRVFFLGFDSTYRWRYLDESYFDGFWARLVDRAGRNKQLGGSYPFRLSTPQTEYRPGSPVKIIARFPDPDQIGPDLEVLHGQVERGDEEPIAITLSPTGGSGEFSATFQETQPGIYFVRVWMGDLEAGSIAKAATLSVEARMPNAEYDQPTLDRATLETIASCSGGRVIELDATQEIPGVFPIGRVSRVLEKRYEIWHAPLLWGSLFVLLCVEWVLRKRWRMI